MHDLSPFTKLDLIEWLDACHGGYALYRSGDFGQRTGGQWQLLQAVEALTVYLENLPTNRSPPAIIEAAIGIAARVDTLVQDPVADFIFLKATRDLRSAAQKSATEAQDECLYKGLGRSVQLRNKVSELHIDRLIQRTSLFSAAFMDEYKVGFQLRQLQMANAAATLIHLLWLSDHTPGIVAQESDVLTISNALAQQSGESFLISLSIQLAQALAMRTENENIRKEIRRDVAQHIIRNAQCSADAGYVSYLSFCLPRCAITDLKKELLQMATLMIGSSLQKTDESVATKTSLCQLSRFIILLAEEGSSYSRIATVYIATHLDAVFESKNNARTRAVLRSGITCGIENAFALCPTLVADEAAMNERLQLALARAAGEPQSGSSLRELPKPASPPEGEMPGP